MDEFGKSDRVRDPPTCLVTVYATIGPNTTPHLSYCVPVEGVVSNMNEIFINRLLEQPRPFSRYTFMYHLLYLL